MKDIIQIATDTSVDADKLKQLILLFNAEKDRAAETAFNDAMAAVQAEMPTIEKDSKNDHTRSRYSSHETVIQTAAPIYTKHGFSTCFYEKDSKKEGSVRVCVDLMHKAGATRSYHLELALDDKGIGGKTNKTSVHATGSTLSYARRYLLCMVFNIATGDDNDGNGEVKTITPEQAAEIRETIARLYDDNGSRWLAYMKVGSVEAIPASRHRQAISSLKEVEAKQNGVKK